MSKKIEIKGIIINLQKINDTDYISLTDIVKGQEDKENDKPNLVIRNWLKNLNTLDFLDEWEQIHNPDFKGVHMDTFKIEMLRNGSKVSVSKWIEITNAKGIVSKAGRYGSGVFAHKDIALNFCYWINPRFQVWFIKEFQRLAEQVHKSENFYLNKIFDNALENERFSKEILQQRKQLPKD